MKKLLLVLALLFAACGGDDGDTESSDATADADAGGETTETTESGEADGDAASGGGTQLAEGDPCGLVTDDEILEALSSTVFTEVQSREGVPLQPAGGQCNITVAHEGGNSAFSVSNGPAEALGLIGEDERTPIDGIGDEAFEARDNYYAVVGDVYVHVANAPGGEEASLALLEAAANAAAND